MPLSSHNKVSIGTVQSYSDILDVCLQAFQSKSATIENCIVQYPDFRELGKLLHSATEVEALPKVNLAAASRIDLRERLLARYDALSVVKSVPILKPHVQGWLRLAIAACITLVILFSGSVSLIHAASLAIPGDKLYGLKR